MCVPCCSLGIQVESRKVVVVVVVDLEVFCLMRIGCSLCDLLMIQSKKSVFRYYGYRREMSRPERERKKKKKDWLRGEVRRKELFF